ncbi:hypothetical protein [Rhizobium sp.]|uniref:hypothetical protein n=1 Tax=Rhizobium sp. TaxID=391 RepID=UPI0028A7FD6C
MRTKLLTGAGGFVAAAISLGYSLYEQRKAEVVPVVAIGASVDAGRWEVAVFASGIASTMPNGARVSPGKQAIAVNMMLENISAESSNLYGELIKLSNVADAPKPQYYLTRDRAILWDLQPRIPEAVTAVWEVPAELELPTVLHLHIDGSHFKPRDNLYAAPGWFSSGSVAEVSLPLDGAAPRAQP